MSRPQSNIRKRISWFAGIFLSLYGGIHLFMYFYQEALLLHPTKLPPGHEFEFKVPFQEVWLTSEDSVKIHAIHFQQQNPSGAILYLHGNTGSNKLGKGVLEDLWSAQMDILMVDYRSFGKSEGSPSEQGFFADARAGFQYLESHYPKDRIVIYGRSLGTGIAAWLAAHTQSRGLVLETPYLSILHSAQENYPWLWVKPVLKYPLRSDEYIRRVACPILILHGTQDEVIPLEDAGALHRLAGENAEMVIFEGGDHNNLGTFEKYHRSIRKFLGNLGF